MAMLVGRTYLGEVSNWEHALETHNLSLASSYITTFFLTTMVGSNFASPRVSCQHGLLPHHGLMADGPQIDTPEMVG